MSRAVRIYADFHNSDIHGRVRLNTAGTLRDLNALGIALSDQLPIIVYCAELEADGRAQFSTEENIWVAQIDWKQLRELGREGQVPEVSEPGNISSHVSAVEADEEFFESLVDAAEELRALWRQCTSHPALVSDDVLLTVNLRRYREVPTLEMYVDAEAKSGKAFAWCVEIARSGSSWAIERSVRMNDSGGQHVLIDLGRIELDSVRVLAAQLPELIEELVGTFDQVNLAA